MKSTVIEEVKGTRRLLELEVKNVNDDSDSICPKSVVMAVEVVTNEGEGIIGISQSSPVHPGKHRQIKSSSKPRA